MRRFIIWRAIRFIGYPEIRQNRRTKNEAETAVRHTIIHFEQNFISQGREKFCVQLTEITGVTVVGLFADIDVHIRERVIVFSLDQDLESKFSRESDAFRCDFSEFKTSVSLQRPSSFPQFFPRRCGMIG